VKSQLSKLDEDEIAFTSRINALRNQREQTMKHVKQLEQDIDVLISVLQGQDEVDNDAMATDYSQGLFLPTEVIQKYNKRIKELGQEKIGHLQKTKLFRRKINLIHWEAELQSLLATHYSVYYTDIQLFRVNRDLQTVIIEGQDAFNQKVSLSRERKCRVV